MRRARRIRACAVATPRVARPATSICARCRRLQRELRREGACPWSVPFAWPSVSSASTRRSRSSPCWCSGSAPAPRPPSSPIVDAVVLRPLPYAAPDRLVTLWDTNTEKGLAHDPISPVNFMDYRALPVFKDAAAWWRPGVNLDRSRTRSGARQHHRGRRQLFDVLGVRAAGRRRASRSTARCSFPNELVAVISDRLWRTRYSADPSIVGRQLSLNGDAVHRRRRHAAEVSLPGRHRRLAAAALGSDAAQPRGAFHGSGRPLSATGTTFDQAQSAVEALALRLQSEFPQTNKGWAIAAGAAARRAARLLPAGADGAVRRRRSAARDRLSERRVAAADARAVARARDRGAHRDGRGAAPARHAAARREPGALGGRARSSASSPRQRRCRSS